MLGTWFADPSREAIPQLSVDSNEAVSPQWIKRASSIDKGEHNVRIRSAECLLFVAIVASAGAVQMREHFAAAERPPASQSDSQPAAQRLLPCAPAQVGIHSVTCGETGVEAPQRNGARRMQRIALWV